MATAKAKEPTAPKLPILPPIFPKEQIELPSEELSPLELSLALRDLASVISTTNRLGASEDIPEGVRYIRMSWTDSFALEAVDVIRAAANKLDGR